MNWPLFKKASDAAVTGFFGVLVEEQERTDKTVFDAPELYERANLVKAVRRLYYAAHWTPDRDVDAVRLWTDVRDAAGFTPGGAPTRRTPPAAPSERGTLRKAEKLERWIRYWGSALEQGRIAQEIVKVFDAPETRTEEKESHGESGLSRGQVEAANLANVPSAASSQSGDSPSLPPPASAEPGERCAFAYPASGHTCYRTQKSHILAPAQFGHVFVPPQPSAEERPAPEHDEEECVLGCAEAECPCQCHTKPPPASEADARTANAQGRRNIFGAERWRVHCWGGQLYRLDEPWAVTCREEARGNEITVVEAAFADADRAALERVEKLIGNSGDFWPKRIRAALAASGATETKEKP